MQKGIRLVLVSILIVSSLFSQEEPELLANKKLLRKARPVFINMAAGISFSNMRDFASSPLIYRGSLFYVGLERARVDAVRESQFGANYNLGIYSVAVNDHFNNSSVHTVSLYYSQLYQIKSISSEDWNFKVGGLGSILGNVRINNAFQNNTQGVEIIPTLFVSAKIKRDLTRDEAKEVKILFVKFTLPARPRDLSFRLNVGLLNSAFRNGYVYTSQGAIINNDGLFADYEYLNGGFRMSSSLDYTVYKSNKNAFRFSYAWEALKTSDKYDQLEMAWHTLKFTLMFNSNGK